MLIDKHMKKKGLCEKAGISPASVTKMGRNGHITTEILAKICAALNRRIENIMEIVLIEWLAQQMTIMGRRVFLMRNWIFGEGRTSWNQILIFWIDTGVQFQEALHIRLAQSPVYSPWHQMILKIN